MKDQEFGTEHNRFRSMESSRLSDGVAIQQAKNPAVCVPFKIKDQIANVAPY